MYAIYIDDAYNFIYKEIYSLLRLALIAIFWIIFKAYCLDLIIFKRAFIIVSNTLKLPKKIILEK